MSVDLLGPALSQEELSGQIVQILPDRVAMQLVDISLDLNVPITLTIDLSALEINVSIF